MAWTLAFDVYGTLIDPHAIGAALGELVGERAAAFSASWRAKQLEYSFRRTVMNDYRDFSVVTADALDATCAGFGVEFSAAQREGLLAAYRELDAFPDAIGGLGPLREAGHALYAFSNGRPSDLEALLAHAGLDALLDGVVSVDAVGVFKPAPRVYAHFNTLTRSTPDTTWLVSGNPFDISGAAACGWRTAWVRRSEAAVFDAWTGPPTATISSLAALASTLDRVP